MDSATLQVILERLWFELPALLGDAWPEVEEKLLGYRLRLSNGDVETSVAQAYIVRDLVAFPVAHRRLIELSAEYMSNVIRGGGMEGHNLAPNQIPLHQVAAESVGNIMRYSDISCPRRVWLNTPRFSVVVRLTVMRPEYSVATEELSSLKEGLVQVQLTALGFDILNAARQETEILLDQDSPPMVFDLKPLDTGHRQIQLDFFQNGQPLRTTTIFTEVVAHQVAEEEYEHTNQALPLITTTPPDLVLHIGWNESDRQLEFTLIREGGASWRSFQPMPMTAEPAAQAIELYRQITSLANVEDPTLAAMWGEQWAIPKKDVDRQIRNLGYHLWRTLLPEDFRTFYASERKQWQDRSLLIYSDEPYLPWELIWPYDTSEGLWKDDGPWCITTRLTRWLRRDAQGNGNEAAPGELSLRAVVVLAPQYQLLHSLPMATVERDTLLMLFSQQGIEDRSPAQPSWGTVMDLLESGGYDWFHVASHGSFYPQFPTGESAIWLEADRALNPQSIEGPSIIQHFRQQRPAFVFNACEIGRQAWSLTRIGGWANQLVSLRASLFIGPLWIVSDSSAATFAATLYRLLLNNETVGSAVQQARYAAKKEGDPTWLAYSVYAHPNARLAK